LLATLLQPASQVLKHKEVKLLIAINWRAYLLEPEAIVNITDKLALMEIRRR
jgi:hypothetical protein